MLGDCRAALKAEACDGRCHDTETGSKHEHDFTAGDRIEASVDQQRRNLRNDGCHEDHPQNVRHTGHPDEEAAGLFLGIIVGESCDHACCGRNSHGGDRAVDQQFGDGRCERIKSVAQSDQ